MAHFEKGCGWRVRRERRLGGNMSIEESITTKRYKNQPLALCSSEDGGTAFNWCELGRLASGPAA
jgi:hypothetical protein